MLKAVFFRLHDVGSENTVFFKFLPLLLVSNPYANQYLREVHTLAVADVQSRQYWNIFDDESISYWQVTFIADMAESAK
jgi:hypothetical protein